MIKFLKFSNFPKLINLRRKLLSILIKYSSMIWKLRRHVLSTDDKRGLLMAKLEEKLVEIRQTFKAIVVRATALLLNIFGDHVAEILGEVE